MQHRIRGAERADDGVDAEADADQRPQRKREHRPNADEERDETRHRVGDDTETHRQGVGPVSVREAGEGLRGNGG